MDIWICRSAQVVEAVKNPPADAAEARDVGLIPQSGDPLEKSMATHSRILPGEPHGQRIPEGYSPEFWKESPTTEHAHIPSCVRITETLSYA